MLPVSDAGVSTLVVTPTIDLMNQWHATLTNASADQLPEPIERLVALPRGVSLAADACSVGTPESEIWYLVMVSGIW